MNDLGGSRDGTGESFAADEVVKEIIRNGGTAVADYSNFLFGILPNIISFFFFEILSKMGRGSFRPLLIILVELIL